MAELSGLSAAVAGDIYGDLFGSLDKVAEMGAFVEETGATTTSFMHTVERAGALANVIANTSLTANKLAATAAMTQFDFSRVAALTAPNLSPLATSDFLGPEMEALAQLSSMGAEAQTAISYGTAVSETKRDLNTTATTSTATTGVEWGYVDWLEAAECVAILAAKQVQGEVNPGRTNAGGWAVATFISATVCMLFGFDLREGIGPFAAILNVLKDFFREE